MTPPVDSRALRVTFAGRLKLSSIEGAHLTQKRSAAIPETGLPGETPSDIDSRAGKLDLARLVEEHGDYLLRYALKHFRDQDACEDLIQDTFLAASRNCEQFRGGSTARTWLTSILRHKIIDRIRSNQVRQTVSLDGLQEEGADFFFNEAEHWTPDAGPREWGTQADTLVEQRQFLAAVQSCLGKLPERFRQILVLREYDGLDREEICGVVGLTSTNVGVILHRARIQLRECLQRTWFASEAG